MSDKRLYVITELCTNTAMCIPECPTIAIHPGPGQHYIDPEVCNGCGYCMDACPVAAIFPVDELPAEYEDAVDTNADMADNAGHERTPRDCDGNPL